MLGSRIEHYLEVIPLYCPWKGSNVRSDTAVRSIEGQQCKLINMISKAVFRNPVSRRLFLLMNITLETIRILKYKSDILDAIDHLLKPFRDQVDI